jgi:hypothetical protein
VWGREQQFRKAKTGFSPFFLFNVALALEWDLHQEVSPSFESHPLRVDQVAHESSHSFSLSMLLAPVSLILSPTCHQCFSVCPWSSQLSFHCFLL